MPAVTGDTTREQVARRLAALDALLPAPAAPAGCGAGLQVSGPGGTTAATGTCEHWTGEPGSMELTWGAARRFQLTPQVAGPDVDAALDALLARWHEHLATLPEAAEPDSAAVIQWPSRDIDGAQALLRHGLAPRGSSRRAPRGRSRYRSAGRPPGRDLPGRARRSR